MKEMTNEERRTLWVRWVRYKWEFTRRNKDYQNEYEDLTNTLDEATKQSKKIGMASKWGFAVDPHNPEPYFLDMGYGLPGNLKIIKSPITDYIVDEGLMTLIGKGHDPNSITNEIIISLDINGPDWLTIASIENIIKNIRRTIEIKEKRILWENIDDYLKVYDLSEGGYPSEEIAKKVFLQSEAWDDKSIIDALDSAIRRVRRFLKKAKELIQGANNLTD
jgi:hypothetical protein